MPKAQTNMAKLYFKYGAMGSSKTAQALITKFNYEERGMRVWLIKPSIDDRDGADIIRSRIGLSAHCRVIAPEDDLLELFRHLEEKVDVIIGDECQFFTPEQIDALREIANDAASVSEGSVNENKTCAEKKLYMIFPCQLFDKKIKEG